ncbi:DUF6541 family protein [Agromyces sp. GXS1127]|uniref:DUF6541 family protein n=1 Tax=Agromyces sp. GXS1127 TaxID=3424181 RepID=UPI003D312FC7
MTWFEAVPAIVVAVFLLFGPGLPIAWAAGARGLSLVAMSAPASLGVLAVASIAAGLVNAAWSLLPVVAVAVALTVAALLLRRAYGRTEPSSARVARTLGPALLGGAVGGGILLVALTAAIGAPDHPNQLYDAVFHLNATRFVLENGTASPLEMTLSTPERSSGFYPTVWHGSAALVAALAGVDVVVATNALTIAVIVGAWPIAVMHLAHVLRPASGAIVAYGGALSAGFAMFPFGLLSWGVLYPNLLGIVVLPVLLAQLAVLLRVAEPSWATPAVLGWLLFALGVGGAALAHPNTVFSLAALGAPIIAAAAWSAVRRATRRRDRVVPIALAAGYVIAMAVLWTIVRPNATHWQPFESIPQAFGEALLLAPLGRPMPWVLAGLFLLGAWAEVRRRRFWVIGGQLVAILLYLVVAAVWNEALRTSIVGVWYNDANRVAALLGVLGIPLAALGASVAHDAVRGWLARTSLARHRFAALAALALVFAVLVAGSQWRTLSTQVPFLRDEAFAFDDDSAIVSPDEVAIFEEVEEIVPPDGMVAGNPWSGAALVYAYTGRTALLPHLQGVYGDERWDVAASLAQDATAVCDELDDLGIDYVLDFGDRYVISGRGDADRYAGLNDLARSEAVTLIAEQGEARLYEISACN